MLEPSGVSCVYTLLPTGYYDGTLWGCLQMTPYGILCWNPLVYSSAYRVLCWNPLEYSCFHKWLLTGYHVGTLWEYLCTYERLHTTYHVRILSGILTPTGISLQGTTNQIRRGANFLEKSSSPKRGNQKYGLFARIRALIIIVGVYYLEAFIPYACFVELCTSMSVMEY